MLDHPVGAGSEGDFRLGFDARVGLELHGSKISSDGGLLLFRELDETLGLHDLAGQFCAIRGVGRTGFITLPPSFVSPPLDGLPDTQTSTTRIGWPLIL